MQNDESQVKKWSSLLKVLVNAIPKQLKTLPVRKVVPVESYTPERKAEFIVSSATTDPDYRQARKEVQKLGIHPDSIPHRRPAPISETNKEPMGWTVSAHPIVLTSSSLFAMHCPEVPICRNERLHGLRYS